MLLYLLKILIKEFIIHLIEYKNLCAVVMIGFVCIVSVLWNEKNEF